MRFANGRASAALRLVSAALVIVFLGVADVATAASPAIGNLSLRGLQIGRTTTLAIDGANLLPRPRLLLDAPIAKQRLHANSSATRVEIDVTLDDTIAPGIYQLRVATAGGVSPPVAVGIDTLAERPLDPRQPGGDEPATELTASQPTAFSGTLAGGQMANVSVSLKKGEQIAVEVEARRLGSALDPVLHVYDHRGVPLAWAQGVSPLGGDARLTFTAPADGDYRVELHDALFQAAGGSFYRLKIGHWFYAGVAFPPVVERGNKATLEFADTNLPAGTKVELNMPADASAEPAPWPAGLTVTGFRPVVLASDMPEIVLASTAHAATNKPIEAPVGISSRFEANVEGVYRVAVEPNEKLHLEVLAARIGSPVDCSLAVRDEQGHELVANDDQPTTVDPALDFTVPANLHKLVVAIKEVTGRGGPDAIYHLAISRANQEGFSLALADDRIEIPSGGMGLLKIVAVRSGYAGPIELTFRGLPPGVGVNDAWIDAGSDETLVSLPASIGPPEARIVTIAGTATDSASQITRQAELPAAGLTEQWQPWLRSRFAIARVGPPSIALTWSGATANLTDDSADEIFRPGQKVPLSVHFGRGGPKALSDGAVRLSLVSTQPMPEKKIRVRVKKRKPVEKVVADPKRALRLDGAPSIARAKNDATVQLIVPGDLRSSEYQLAIRADLLAADNATVVATTYTPVLSISVAAMPAEAAKAAPPKAVPKPPKKATTPNAQPKK
jgi:hypothetical protein